LFNWHESKKDRTYIAPLALAALSFVHKDAHVPGTPGRQPTPLRYFMLAAAAGLVATTVIGVVMAYRFSQRPMVATVCLLGGIALPAVRDRRYNQSSKQSRLKIRARHFSGRL
jgi:Flp pilus assembly protein TadB